LSGIDNEIDRDGLAMILKALEKYGDRLRTDPKDARPLRELQRELNPILYTASNKDASFLAYFLSVFVDDFFYNLAGDVPYSEEIQHNLVTQIGAQLTNLANIVAGKIEGSRFDAIEDLVSVYLEAISQIRTEGEGHV